MRSGDNVAYYCLKHLWWNNAYGILIYCGVNAELLHTFLPNSTDCQALLCLSHDKFVCILFQF